MNTKNLLEEDKEKLLAKLTASDSPHACVKVLEDELNRILFSASTKEQKENEARELRLAMETAKAALPLIDSTGKVEVYERAEEEAAAGEKEKMRSRGLLGGGCVLSLISLLLAAAGGRGLLLIPAFLCAAGGLIFVSMAVRKPQLLSAKAKPQRHIEVSLDLEKLYHNLSMLLAVIDENLEENWVKDSLQTEIALEDQAGQFPMDEEELKLFPALLECAYAQKEETYAREII